MRLKIISGGQSGVDRAGLDAAIESGLEYGGWCALGGLAEDYPSAPGLLDDYPNLTEAPSADPRIRTIMNIRSSDTTLVIRNPKTDSAGTDLAMRACFYLSRPMLISDGSPSQLKAWLVGLGQELKNSLVLNIAGPRESEQIGAYRDARILLDATLKDFSG